jgi:hypothetical protein
VYLVRERVLMSHKDSWVLLIRTAMLPELAHSERKHCAIAPGGGVFCSHPFPIGSRVDPHQRYANYLPI